MGTEPESLVVPRSSRLFLLIQSVSWSHKSWHWLSKSGPQPEGLWSRRPRRVATPVLCGCPQASPWRVRWGSAHTAEPQASRPVCRETEEGAGKEEGPAQTDWERQWLRDEGQETPRPRAEEEGPEAEGTRPLEGSGSPSRGHLWRSTGTGWHGVLFGAQAPRWLGCPSRSPGPLGSGGWGVSCWPRGRSRMCVDTVCLGPFPVRKGTW